MTHVLAYSGSAEASAAVASFVARGVEVVTVTLDVGQSEALDEIRARALRCGAVRAHVVDARELFVRTCVLPAVQTAELPDLQLLARPLITKTLAEVAAIEGRDAVAEDPAPPSHDASGRQRHLLVRPSMNPERAPEEAARLDITFDGDVPVAVNGVPMSLTELLECLSLIGGQHGVGYTPPVSAPAAAILRAAYAAAKENPSGTVHLTLHRGTIAAAPRAGRGVELVAQP
jgi:argininosuccinate synthase